jgi:5-methylthioadenosine/S-adenosylhomocysteine deaminase
VTPSACDLLLAGGCVVTPDRFPAILRDGAVAVRAGALVAVGPAAEVEAAWRPRERIAGDALASLPGLVNTHVHAAMSLLKGRAGDRPLARRLREVVWPFARAMDEDSCRDAARLGCLEMLRAGITTFNDMWPVLDATAEAATEAGLRAVLSPYLLEDSRDLDALPDMPGRWSNPRVSVAVGIQSLYGCPEPLARRAAEIAADHGLPIHMHACETRAEVEAGHTVARIDELGLLRPGTILAHAIHVTDEDIATIAARGAGVAHNPVSNAKLGTGVARTAALRAAGIAVGLGSDSAAANDRHDLFDEMRLALLLDRRHGPGTLGAADALRMATLDGARVLGLDRQIGSLEVGKRADLITVDLSDPKFAPLDLGRADQVLAQLVFSAGAPDVRDVVVDGRVVLRNRNPTTVDPLSVIERGRDAASRCLAAAGIA